MAEARRFVCGGCGHAVEAWSDGNPYYFDDAGAKRYAYHPDHDGLARCIGNDSPALCLGCGAECLVDSQAPTTACPTCNASELVSTFELDGKTCPFCKTGKFSVDPEFFCIS